jgi:Protein of unknown function (DUF3106)
VTADASSCPSLLTRLLRATLASACLAMALGALGQTSTGPVAWSQLSPDQRGVLAPIERDWKTISPSQQQKWAEVANRFPALPAEERSRIQQRLADWSRLSPQQRASARLNYQEARELSPQQRQQQWEAYRALTADQRRELTDSAQRGRPGGRAQANNEPSTKPSFVRPPVTVPAKPVGPTVVQRGAGATTSLVSKPPTPPLHQQAGLPKVAASPGFVDSATLLPRRGAQGAATVAPEADDNSKPRKAK